MRPPASAPAAGSLPAAEEVSAQRRCVIPGDGEPTGVWWDCGSGVGAAERGIGQSLNELSGRRRNHITAACVCVQRRVRWCEPRSLGSACSVLQSQ